MKANRVDGELRKRCEQVNAVLQEEAIRLKLGTKQSLARLDESRGDMPSFSRWAELEFREYVRRHVEHGPASATGLVMSGARLLGLSPATTKRYMGKLRTKGGPFGGLGDIVVINPRYSPPESDSYWQEVAEQELGEEDGA